MYQTSTRSKSWRGWPTRPFPWHGPVGVVAVLSLNSTSRQASTFRITIDASSLGYEPVVLERTVEDETLAVIPSVTLSMGCRELCSGPTSARRRHSLLDPSDNWVAQISSPGGLIISRNPFEWSHAPILRIRIAPRATLRGVRRLPTSYLLARYQRRKSAVRHHRRCGRSRRGKTTWG